MPNNTQKVVVTKQGITFCGFLFIVLLLLKVGVVETTVMGWSWWWIASPLWGPTVLTFGVIAIILVVLLIIFFISALISAIVTIIDNHR